MLVKTIFNKFKRFPWKNMGVISSFEKDYTPMSTNNPSSPVICFRITEYNEEYLSVLLPDTQLEISLHLPKHISRDLNNFLQQLDSNVNELLTEYAVYLALTDGYHPSLPLPVEQLRAIKQDTIDILRSYSISEELLSELGKYDILIPVALFDITGHLFYQICTTNGEKVITFTGVDNSGIRKEENKPSDRWWDIFPWEMPIKLGEIDSPPIFFSNVLFGLTPILGIIEKRDNSVPGIGTYFDEVLSRMAASKNLNIALNFDRFIDNELVPDSLLEKISNKQPLSEEECENFSKFLDMVSIINSHDPLSSRRCLYRYIHVQKFLKNLGLVQSPASRLPKDLLNLSFIVKEGRKRKTYLVKDEHIHTVYYRRTVYVIGPEDRTVWAFKVSGIDWKQVKRGFLNMVYNYNKKEV